MDRSVPGAGAESESESQSAITSEAAARARDARDPLAPFRERFYLPPGAVYLDGNSLGLLSRDAEAAVLAALDAVEAARHRRLAAGRPALVHARRGARRADGAARRRGAGRGRRHRRARPSTCTRWSRPSTGRTGDAAEDRRRRARLPLRPLRAAAARSRCTAATRRPTWCSCRAATAARSTRTT